MTRSKIIRYSITGIVLALIVTRCVECIETAMPYEHKMVEKDMVMSNMSLSGQVWHVYQPGASYMIKSYGKFDVKDLDSLRDKRCHVFYLDRRAFGFLPTYRICKLEYNGQVIFDHIMYEGYEYMGDRYPKMPKNEWIEEWGDSVEIYHLKKRRKRKIVDILEKNK